MKKKADFGARTLVTIILTILGFVILLVFLLNVLNTGKVDKEACHQSVILRGTAGENLGSFVPLNCKTEKICITTKTFGGKCEDFENSKGVTYIRVNKKEQVEKALAESLVDCWSMMGEGKLSLFHQFLANEYGIGDVYPSCVMCARIAFDKEALAKSKISLSDVNVETYMATHAIGSEEDVSYLDYISGINSARLSIGENLNFPDILSNKSNQTSANIALLSEEEKKAEIEKQKNNFSVQSDEIGILFMQVSAPKGGETLANLAKTSLGVGVIAGGTFGFKNTFGVVSKVGRFVCSKGPAAIACAALAVGGIFVQQANVAANRNIAAGACSDVVMGDKARDGCSVVRAVNYDEESIGAYCVGIESSK